MAEYASGDTIECTKPTNITFKNNKFNDYKIRFVPVPEKKDIFTENGDDYTIESEGFITYATPIITVISTEDYRERVAGKEYTDTAIPYSNFTGSKTDTVGNVNIPNPFNSIDSTNVTITSITGSGQTLKNPTDVSLGSRDLKISEHDTITNIKTSDTNISTELSTNYPRGNSTKALKVNQNNVYFYDESWTASDIASKASSLSNLHKVQILYDYYYNGDTFTHAAPSTIANTHTVTLNGTYTPSTTSTTYTKTLKFVPNGYTLLADTIKEYFGNTISNSVDDVTVSGDTTLTYNLTSSSSDETIYFSYPRNRIFTIYATSDGSTLSSSNPSIDNVLWAHSYHFRINSSRYPQIGTVSTINPSSDTDVGNGYWGNSVCNYNNTIDTDNSAALTNFNAIDNYASDTNLLQKALSNVSFDTLITYESDGTNTSVTSNEIYDIDNKYIASLTTNSSTNIATFKVDYDKSGNAVTLSSINLGGIEASNGGTN